MKMKLFGAAAALTLLAGPAFAQSYNATATVNVAGTIPATCGARINNGASLSVDFATLAATDTASSVTQSNPLILLCNDPDGYRVSYSSANGGYLVLGGVLANAGDQYRRISYSANGDQPTRGSLPAAWTSLATTQSETSTPSTSSISVSMGVKVSGVRVPDANVAGGYATSVFAGAYSDVITISVAAL